jgi:hypothetical protein
MPIRKENFMDYNKMNAIFRVASLVTTFVLLMVINTHINLSSLFYILGGSTTSAETVVNGKFNTFFISSLGITSFIVIATYILITQCQTILAKVLIVIADLFLIGMAFTFSQERVLHNFTFDTQVRDALNADSQASSVLMGTSDITLLTIVLVHMVIMLLGVIRAYKFRRRSVPDKASKYD